MGSVAKGGVIPTCCRGGIKGPDGVAEPQKRGGVELRAAAADGLVPKSLVGGVLSMDRGALL